MVHPDYTVKRAYIFAHGKGSSCTRKAWRVMLTVAEYIAAARREGVIEGLERALRFVAPFVLQEHSDRIRAEIERLREEKP